MSEFDPIFDAAAREWNVDPALLRAVSAQESGGKADAVSKKGARGLMGIMPDTGRAMGVTDPADPAQNIYAGAKYLSQALDAEKSPADALRFYHGGPGWRAAYGPESQGYVPAVSAHYQRIAGAPPVPAPAAKSTSFDDFLARTGAGDATPQDAQAAFLARTGAVDAPAPEASTPADPVMDSEGHLVSDTTTPGAVLSRDVASIKSGISSLTAENIRNALAEKPGYTASNILPMRVKNDANGRADPSLGMEWDLGPLRGIGNALVDLGEGPATGKVTPEASNLLLGAALSGGLTPSLARGTGAAVADTAAYGARTEDLYAKNRGNALAGPEAGAPALPQPGMGAPAPQSVGAAASSTTEAGLTPKEVLAYRATAEGQKLLEPQPIGTPDRALYIPNAVPNSAEIEQTVTAARELKSLGVTAPKVSDEAKAIAQTNNEARASYFAQTAGSPVDVENARAVRGAQAEKDLAQTWANKKPADAQPVIEAADAIKASLDGRRPVVRNAVDAVTKELFDKDGALITDPEQLYGVRKHLDDLMSKEAGADDPKSVRALSNLQALKTTLDAQIEKAAPGFGDYLKNFADASKRIDEMEVLQKHEPKLFDTGNRMTYAGVQRMMKNIVDSRNAPGVNPYKSITDDTMQRLWALRDDLRRSASAKELASAPGSDTVQNAWDAAKGVMGGMAGEAAIHGGANLLLGPLGSPAAAITKNVLGSIMSGRTARRQTARGMEMLHTDPKTLYNPLAGP